MRQPLAKVPNSMSWTWNGEPQYANFRALLQGSTLLMSSQCSTSTHYNQEAHFLSQQSDLEAQQSALGLPNSSHPNQSPKQSPSKKTRNEELIQIVKLLFARAKSQDEDNTSDRSASSEASTSHDPYGSQYQDA
ncbi:hypothetical protein TEA_023248 [Camellia sinensis var. sinensis]|uniref:Uncharacterized protein n=1 Tax=Camellia sinensis var. sinensis TaxID=542762 RepID=A0A4S4EFQ5_CAMSN|nr:hypothetical protein TEA_023248 [Camellia sinensis var. sinensis]